MTHRNSHNCSVSLASNDMTECCGIKKSLTGWRAWLALLRACRTCLRSVCPLRVSPSITLFREHHHGESFERLLGVACIASARVDSEYMKPSGCNGVNGSFVGGSEGDERWCRKVSRNTSRELHEYCSDLNSDWCKMTARAPLFFCAILSQSTRDDSGVYQGFWPRREIF